MIVFFQKATAGKKGGSRLFSDFARIAILRQASRI
jgi:hypothetical protein